MKFKIPSTFSLIFFIPLMAFCQAVFRINENKTYQVISSFGASDAWSDEVVKNLKPEQRKEVAELLFSTDTNIDGSFKGIGLTLWRYNIGAGSAEQGDSSGIGNPRRRTESFLTADGKYDWSKQAGHQIMLGLAKKYGINNFVMFANSPYVLFTKNGKAFGNRDSKFSNLRKDKYVDFSDYICNTIKHFDSLGIHFKYVSPVNEPQWNWSSKEGQEGSAWTNSEISMLVKCLDKKIIKNSLQTKILIPESGTLFCLNPDILVRPGRQNQIRSFFIPHKRTYIGNLPSVAGIIAGHSYWTVWPLWWSRMVRHTLRKNTKKLNLDFWMTEYCVLEKYRELKNAGSEYKIRTANIVAQVIHHDLVYGNATSWQFWTAIEGGDEKFSLLNTHGDNGPVTSTKTLWVLGNYSRFIRPGAVRTEVKGRKHRDLFVSAYLYKDQLIIVVVNRADYEQSVCFEKPNAEGLMRAYETSENRNLEYAGSFIPGNPVKVPKNSTTTFVMKRNIFYFEF